MKKIFLLFIVCTFLMGCENDPLDEGIESTVKGSIIDQSNNVSFQDVKLKIAEFKRHTNGITGSDEFIQWIDSTYTDSNGDYFLKFKTSGKGNLYKLYVEEKPDVWTYYYNPIRIENIGGFNEHDLSFLQLYPVNLDISLNDLENIPIRLSTLFVYAENFETSNSEIQVLIYTNKFTDTQLNFRRKNLDGVYEFYSTNIPATNSTSLTNYSIVLNNSDFN